MPIPKPRDCAPTKPRSVELTEAELAELKKQARAAYEAFVRLSLIRKECEVARQAESDIARAARSLDKGPMRAALEGAFMDVWTVHARLEIEGNGLERGPLASPSETEADVYCRLLVDRGVSGHEAVLLAGNHREHLARRSSDVAGKARTVNRHAARRAQAIEKEIAELRATLKSIERYGVPENDNEFGLRFFRTDSKVWIPQEIARLKTRLLALSSRRGKRQKKRS